MNTKAPTKQFYSPSGEELRITHGNGAVALIGPDPKPLPKHLWQAAIRAGAQVSGQSGLTTEESRAAKKAGEDGAGGAENDQRFTIIEKLKQAMREAVDAYADAEEAGRDVTVEFASAFTSNGIPQVKWLEGRVGFSISADQRDQAWADLQPELEESEEQDDTEGSSE